VNIITCLAVFTRSMWTDAADVILGTLAIVCGVIFFGGLLYMGYGILRAASNIGRRDD